MGALHAGHLSLIRKAAQENTDVFVSIYVNPTQFGVNEDLASYPRTWDIDLQMLEEMQNEFVSKLLNASPGRIAAIFAPTTQTIYPTLPPTSEISGQGSFVTITPLASMLEGTSRPVFFRGVTTVCMKLFNIVSPERVYFGQKDIQQTVVIKRMVRDFHLPTEVRVGPTMREDDGLAMSSRNVYLGTRRRKVATVLSKALRAAGQQYMQGKRQRHEILGPANEVTGFTATEQSKLSPSDRVRFEVDYISLADPESLEELKEVDETRGAILSGAVKMLPVEDLQNGEDCGMATPQGPVRLIDNIILEPI